MDLSTRDKIKQLALDKIHLCQSAKVEKPDNMNLRQWWVFINWMDYRIATYLRIISRITITS